MYTPAGQDPLHPGRPLALTPNVHATILGVLQDGGSLAEAAAVAGVDRAQVYRWRKRGNAGETYFADFAANAIKAEAAFKAKARERIRKLADQTKSWVGHAWLLERRFPKEYGRNRAEVESYKIRLSAAEAEIIRLRTAPPKLDDASIVAILSAMHPDLRRKWLQTYREQQRRDEAGEGPPPPKTTRLRSKGTLSSADVETSSVKG
jgi:transposase-like protein